MSSGAVFEIPKRIGTELNGPSFHEYCNQLEAYTLNQRELAANKGIISAKGTDDTFHKYEIVPSLSPYDIYRKAYVLPEVDAYPPVPLEVVNADIKCPVCLGIIDTAYCIQSCLHRFCRECIVSSLRLGRKECPSCREIVSSKRNTRRDHRIEAIISIIYPDVAAHEKKVNSLIATSNKEVIRTRSLKRPRELEMSSGAYKRNMMLDPESEDKVEANNNDSSIRPEEDLVEIIVDVDPIDVETPSLKLGFLHAPVHLRISELKMYIKQRLSIECDFTSTSPISKMELVLMHKGIRFMLANGNTVGETWKAFDNGDGTELILFYQYVN